MSAPRIEPARREGGLHLGLTLALFAALSLVCYVDRFIIGALLTPIKTSLGLSDEQLGRLNVAFVVALVGIAPFAGAVGDRVRRKPLVLGSLLLWSIASIGSGWANTYGQLLLWRVLVGLGEGVFSSLAASWLADAFDARCRSFAFAVLTSTSQLAAWVAYHFGGVIAARSGWQHAFFVAGVPGIVLALGLFAVREPRPGGSDGEIAGAEPVATRELLQFLHGWPYRLYVAGYLVRMLAVSGLFFWGAVYLHRQYGVANREATSFIGAAYLITGAPGIFLGATLAGRLAQRRRGAFAQWIAGGEVLSAGCVLIVLVATPGLATAKALLLAQMFFAGNSWGVINPLLFEIAPARLRSTAAAIALAVSSGGSAVLGSQVIGWVSDHFGLARALLLVPVAYVGAAALWLALAERQQRDDAAERNPLPSPNNAIVQVEGPVLGTGGAKS